MSFRKLRIAWSVFWGVGCLLFVVLWANSNVSVDIFAIPVTQATYFRFGCFPNTFQIGMDDEGLDDGDWYKQYVTDDWIQNYLEYYGTPWSAKPSFAMQGGNLALPFWFCVLLSTALTAAPLVFTTRWRFSLRTLLIVATLVAVALGLATWAAR